MILTRGKQIVHGHGRQPQHTSLRLLQQNHQGALRARIPVVCSSAVNESLTAVADQQVQAAASALVAAAAPAATEDSVPQYSQPAAAAPSTDASPQNTYASSSRDGSSRTLVKVSKASDAAKCGRYIMEQLLRIPAGETVLLRALGGETNLKAMKIIDRASTMLQNDDSSSSITFQIASRKVPFGDQGASTRVTEYYLVKSPAVHTTELLEGSNPMYLRRESTFDKVVSYVSTAAYRADMGQRISPIAQLVLPGRADVMSLVLAGLREVRSRLSKRGEKDVLFKVSKTLTEVPALSQQQRGEEDGEAAAAAQAADTSSSSADAPSGAETWMKSTYTISVYLCDPRSPSKSSRARAQRGSTPRPTGKNPKTLEVPEAEWSQLKEQLEMVPQLTEQLQFMTQQHEQVLKLLASQQQQQQQQ